MEKASKQKMWQRTHFPGLFRHVGGGYYGRFFIVGKKKFVPHDRDLSRSSGRATLAEKVRRQRVVALPLR